MKLLWVLVFVMCKWVNGFLELDELNAVEVSYVEEGYHGDVVQPLMVGLTLIPGDKKTVCLDGTPPGYHIHRGYGSGANSWLIHLEGGGWCHSVRSCKFRKTTRRGSSNFMEKEKPFVGILSNKSEENPDFFNWNRVLLRYCDGASFSGDSYYKDEKTKTELQFRGKRIWLAGMKELMDKGMHSAKQALLSGCSAGGLASILHCDEFAEMFPGTTKVKCLSDAGLFLDAADVAGGHTLRKFYGGVVSLQQLAKNLSRTCTSQHQDDPTSCFFPQNLIDSIKTPMFILNSAYDTWQIHASLAPSSADPHREWNDCKKNHAKCTPPQIKFLQEFRGQMLKAVENFAKPKQNGLFINSCFAHCQSETQDMWFSDKAPVIKNKGIAQAVGDWYFDRTGVKEIDCPYPCDKSCLHLVKQDILYQTLG